ncbi:MAG: TonB-dependent receptor, partial [Bacteroidales bacterium]|nr:TonB-dependent receptor [Bacteroidales bacterium]
VNITTSYAFGKRELWQIDARWNYGSGFPFTQTKGLYPKNEPNSAINQNHNSTNESIGIIYGDINGGQLPAYHRLDVNIKRRFIINPQSTVELNAGVSNVYNYYNIFYINRKTNEKIYQLPFMWTLSCNINF